WKPGLPGAASDVSAEFSDATNRTINYDYGGPSIQFSSMILANGGTGSTIFSQAGNTFNSELEVIAGTGGNGYWQMSGGAHNVNRMIFGIGSSAPEKGVGT